MNVRHILLALAVCVVALAPCQSADAPKIINPDKVAIVGPEESEAGELVVLTLHGAETAGLDWKITPPEAAARMHIDADKRTVCFATRQGGQYVFSLAVAHDGVATCLVHVLRNGLGPEPDPEPDPKPDPEPDPTPEPGKRFVLVVAESESRTPQQAATLMGLRGYLVEKGHEFRFVDPDIKDAKGKVPEWFSSYGKYLDKVSTTKERKVCGPDGCVVVKETAPTLLIGAMEGDDVSAIHVEPLPDTAAEAIDAVKKRGG